MLFVADYIPQRNALVVYNDDDTEAVSYPATQEGYAQLQKWFGGMTRPLRHGDTPRNHVYGTEAFQKVIHYLRPADDFRTGRRFYENA